MQQKIILYKKVGETPLECIEKFKKDNIEYSDIPMTYAGRLDPMAEGLLLVLVGEECKKKEEYLNLDKEYEVEILFGFSTDSFDILGKIKEKNLSLDNLSLETVGLELQKFVGKFEQEYPAYSSKTINGVHLHALANSDLLPEEMPTKQVEIYSIDILDFNEKRGEDLGKEILERILCVNGEFRQKEILEIWQENLKNCEKSFQVLKIRVSCSSGTYMRSLANNLGKKLGIPSLAFSIKRTKIGDFGK